MRCVRSPMSTPTLRYRDGAQGAPPEILRQGQRLEGAACRSSRSTICKEHGIEIAYLDTVRNSSSDLVRRFLAHHGVESSLESYEDFALSRRSRAPRSSVRSTSPTPGATEAILRYRMRRKIEARNPELIKEVFAAPAYHRHGLRTRRPDVLLNEIGVVADGVDFSPTSKDIAPKEVKRPHPDRLDHRNRASGQQLRSRHLPRGLRAYAGDAWCRRRWRICAASRRASSM